MLKFEASIRDYRAFLAEAKSNAQAAGGVGEDDLDFGSLDMEDFDPYEGSSPANKIVRQHDTHDLAIWSMKNLQLQLYLSYRSKESLLVYGDPGIGKSSVVKQAARNIAKSSAKREFFVWNDATNEQRSEAIAHPEKYFPLIDVRCVQLAETDIMGIPDIHSDLPQLKTKQLEWIYYMSLKGSEGFLFLDELNQATPEVQNALFQVVLDKQAYMTKLAPEWVIVGAGNLQDEFTQNAPLKPALTNRFAVAYLVVEPEEWLTYAAEAGVDNRIIAFVHADPAANFCQKPKSESSQFATPRAMCRLSEEIKTLEKMKFMARKGRGQDFDIYEEIKNRAAGLCGAEWTIRFIAFCQHIHAFDWNQIVKDAGETVTNGSGTSSKLMAKDKSELWALLTYVYNTINKLFGKGAIQKTPENVKKVEDVTRIVNGLDDEWALYFLKLFKSLNEALVKEYMMGVQTLPIDKKVQETFLKVRKPEFVKYLV
jgi:hypothetical protein